VSRRRIALVVLLVALVGLAAGAMAQHPQGDIGRLRPWLVTAAVVAAVGVGVGWGPRRGVGALGIAVVLLAVFFVSDYATAPITASSGQADCGTLFNSEPISRGPCVGRRRSRQVAVGAGVVVAIAGAVVAVRARDN
jgi:hypothetical protein